MTRYQTLASHFTTFNQPEDKPTHPCQQLSPALVTRFILRTTIPIILGLTAGMLVKWGVHQTNIESKNNLLELSDFVGCTTTLIITYAVNSLLDCCWPTSPYSSSDPFEAPNHNEQTTTSGFGYA